MKATELREKSAEQLNEQLLTLLRDQFKSAHAEGNGQLGQSHLLKQAKRDIARVKTVLNRKGVTDHGRDTNSKYVTGRVVSDKMDKTITVVHRAPVKATRCTVSTCAALPKLHAHDENNECRIGDTVTIKETRPLAKTKSWTPGADRRARGNSLKPRAFCGFFKGRRKL